MGLSSKHEPSYAIFVDEAGDPGVRAVSPVAPNGSSEWFVMSAVVIDQKRDEDTIRWIREIKEEVRQTQRSFFHYKDLPAGRRRVKTCEMLAAKPCRLFTVASHKPNMSGYENLRPDRRHSQAYFYNWMLRVLLERVTPWISARSTLDHGEVRKARLVLSTAGGLHYGQLKAYHELMRLQGKNAFLGRRTVDWRVLSNDLYEPVRAQSNAGVQLADIVASAFYQGVNAAGEKWDTAPAIALKPRVANLSGRFEDCGLTLMPFQPAKRQFDDDRASLFRGYGFRI